MRKFAIIVLFSMFLIFPALAYSSPVISVTQQPASGASYALGQNVPVAWSVADSGTINFISLSLYRNGSNIRTLYQRNTAGSFAYNWTAADVTPGSGFHFHFFAVNTAGQFTEKDSPTFSVGSGFVLNIPGNWLGDPDENGTATPETGFGVNSVSGNFYYSEGDASLPGVALPFVFMRSYNSQAIPVDSFGSTVNTPLGWGWSHSYNIQLRVDGTGMYAEVIWDDGRRDRFEKSSGNWQASSPGNFTELAQAGTDYAWRVKTEDQTEFHFDTSKRLTEIRARTGQAIRLEYLGNDLKRIIDTSGRIITLSYADGRITRVDLPPSRNFRFEYTGDGFLSKVWDMRGNYHRYVYRRHNGWMMLAEIHQANVAPEDTTRPALMIIYDNQYRVTEQHTAHSLIAGSPGYLFDWSVSNSLRYNTPASQGATFTWNASGQVTKVVPHNFPAGAEENITYAAAQGPKAVLLQSYNDPLGHNYSFSYNDTDSPNNPSKITLPSGEFYDINYDSTHDVVSSLTPEGMNATYVRNTFGSPEKIEITGPEVPAVIRTDVSYQLTGSQKGEVNQVASGGNTKFEVVSRTNDGQPLEVRHFVSDTAYLTTTYLYDSAGRMVSTQDHRGTYTCYYYDDNDNVTDIVSGLTTGCTLAPASASVRRVHYEYDAQDRVVSMTDGYGGSDPQIVSYLYNESGVKEQMTSGSRAVQYVYDNDLRLFKIIDVTTGREDRVYKLAGGRLEIVKENANTSQGSGSRIVRREYDANGNVTVLSSCADIDQPDVSSSDCTSSERRNYVHYDDLNRITQVLETLELNGDSPTVQRATDYIYTDNGRTVTIAKRDGGGIGDGARSKQVLEHDAAGRLFRVTDFDGDVGYAAQAEYDSMGRVIKVIDPANLETHYTYDRLGRPTSQTDLRGQVQWAYNDSAGTVTRTEPDGSSVTDTYDRLGQLSQQTTSDGNTFSFFYNSRGWLVKEVWDGPEGTGERNYVYNDFGEVMSVEDPFSQTISYTRDTAGRISYRNYAGMSIGYTHNAFGQISAMNTPAGNFNFGYQEFTHALESIQYPNGVTTSFQRNPLGELENLTSTHAGLGNFLQYGISLDALGRRKAVQVNQPLSPQFSDQDMIFNYLPDGLLSDVGNIPVNYDGRGNLTALPSPVSASFVYDVLNRVTKVDATQHKYDAGRNRIESVRKGVATRYLVDVEPGLPDVVATMDGTNQAQEVFIYGPGGLLAAKENASFRFIHQDFNYNVMALTDNSGNIDSSFAYTPYGLDAGAQGDSDFPFRFSGGVGVMSDPEGVVQMRARYYHPGIRQFTSADLVPGEFGRPQSLGRYGFVEGSAMDGADPSGLIYCLSSRTKDTYRRRNDPTLSTFTHGVHLYTKNYSFRTRYNEVFQTTYKNKAKKSYRKMCHEAYKTAADYTYDRTSVRIKYDSERLFEPSWNEAWNSRVPVVSEAVRIKKPVKKKKFRFSFFRKKKTEYPNWRETYERSNKREVFHFEGIRDTLREGPVGMAWKNKWDFLKLRNIWSPKERAKGLVKQLFETILNRNTDK